MIYDKAVMDYFKENYEFIHVWYWEGLAFYIIRTWSAGTHIINYYHAVRVNEEGVCVDKTW